MNAEQYRNAGYRVSLQVAQAEIDRAERDAADAYVGRVCAYNASDTAHRAAVMQLAFIILCKRAAVATRSGGKEKNSPQMSDSVQTTQQDFENADRLLRAVQTLPGHPSELVDDIAGIYYRNQYLSL